VGDGTNSKHKDLPDQGGSSEKTLEKKGTWGVVGGKKKGKADRKRKKKSKKGGREKPEEAEQTAARGVVLES